MSKFWYYTGGFVLFINIENRERGMHIIFKISFYNINQAQRANFFCCNGTRWKIARWGVYIPDKLRYYKHFVVVQVNGERDKKA